MALIEKKISDNEFKCYEDKLDWVHLTGYGDSPESAKANYFVKTCTLFRRNPATLITTDV